MQNLDEITLVLDILERVSGISSLICGHSPDGAHSLDEHKLSSIRCR